MRTIIVDDEMQGRKTLEILLKKNFPEIEIIGEADSVESAVKIINANPPDLVFLDIEMPGGSGFRLLEMVSNTNFNIIFVTAFDSYAIRAIRVSALDYLLKPVNVDDLRHAVKKALDFKKKSINQNQQLNILKDQVTFYNIGRIALPTDQGFEFVDFKNIIRCCAERNYTLFILANREQIIVSRNLGEFEDLLPSGNFIRVHHSYIVNILHIRKYIKGRTGHLIMSDGANIPVSTSRKEALLGLFSYK